MKKVFTLFFVLMLTVVSVFAQVPQKMSYQAVVRNASNSLVANQNVSVRISVLQGSSSGATAYMETHTVSTNANGLMTVTIGEGTTVSGTFSDIDWANGPFYLKSEIDPDGGINYNVTSVQQLLSVPYALYAATSGNGEGPQGPQGETGPQGPAGADGVSPTVTTTTTANGTFVVITDATGSHQFFVANGADGATGAQGPQGIQGPAGQDGATGPQGPQGIQGPAGADGATGPQGVAGADGVSPTVTTTTTANGTFVVITDANGSHQFFVANGADGAAGAQGPQGIQGPAGQDGATGPQGVAGADGVSPTITTTPAANGYYLNITDANGTQQILVANGADGTMTFADLTPEQIESLRGPQGLQGEQGPAGRDGATGPQGVAGADGVSPTITTTPAANGYYINVTDANGSWQILVENGEQGATGPQGPQGERGATGPQGPRGLQGETGATGPQGVAGADGFSPIVSVTTLDTMRTQVTITDANGPHTFIVKNGSAGAAFVQDQADWLESNTSSNSYIMNKPTLSAVATSGSYNDLTNKPTLFDGNYNSLTNKPTIPTTTSELTNNSGFLTSYTETDPTIYDWAKSATKPVYTYSEIQNTPTLFDGNYNSLTNKPTLFDGNYNSLTNKPTLFDGNYNSLTNKPTIPTTTSELTNNSGFLTSETETDPTIYDWAKSATKPVYTYSEIQNTPTLFDGNYNSLTNKPTLFDGNYNSLTNKPTLFDGNYNSLTNKPTIPTTTSELTNNSGFLTSETQNLANVVTNGNSAGNAQLKDVANPTDAQDAVTKAYLENIISSLQQTIQDLQNQIDAIRSSLPGVFSISDGQTVKFSKGNLQYIANTDTWKFADNQYDYFGTTQDDSGRDLFGWGDLTGTNTSTTDNDYSWTADWGTKIDNNGTWRTLTHSEWTYLCSGRANADSKRGQATVNGTTGYIFLPDSWTLPDGCTFTANPGDYTTNTYTTAQWEMMESAGALFLPAAGHREGTSVSRVGSYGYYMASTTRMFGHLIPYYMYFTNFEYAGVSFGYRYDGRSVRLATTVTAGLPSVSTNSVTFGGEVTSEGGVTVFERGMCWSTSPYPTIADSHTTDGAGTGTFTSSTTGLTQGTTYYVRAYATNSVGTAYGEQREVEIGTVPGVFSISATQTVKFSNGNLQYIANTDTWKFADNQYDYFGTTQNDSGRDLFGWGDLTGTNTSTSYGDYSWTADWGTKIDNNGTWRTLTNSEWTYLYSGRANADSKRGQATVNGTTGYIFLPDSWTLPSGCTFTANPGNYTTNTYTTAQWAKMESAGALFLPSAGNRNGTSVSNAGSYGQYWSSTGEPYSDFYYYFIFSGNSNYIEWDIHNHIGQSVRLAKEL